MARTRDKGRRMPVNMYLMPGHAALPHDKQRFRYKLPNGKFRAIRNADGTTADYDRAVEIAEQANELRESQHLASGNSVTSLGYWLHQYLSWAEKQDPSLKKSQAWRQRKNEMSAFASMFNTLHVSQIKLADLDDWWYSLTYDQQHNRRSAFSKWFLWMMTKDVVKLNPFAVSDDRPHLIEKKKPSKQRLPLEIDQFWAVYREADEHVQIAMGIGLITMMREYDICHLTFDEHVVDGHLRKSISKSVNQRGTVGASHLDFDLSKHVLLRDLINRSRRLSMRHQRCPYLISYAPKQKRLGKTKTHTHQVTPRMLIAGFAEARERTGLWKDIPENRTPPTFHEIKGLAINEAKRHGFDKGDISKQAAHTDGRVTDGYNANHEPIWTPANVVFDTKIIGGEFK